MTQPVQEPSNERDIGGLAWRTAQLARRPPPFSGTPWPWILLEAGGQTLPGDANFDPLLFDGLYWDPNLVTLNPADVEDGSDNTFDIDILSFGGTDYFQPTLRLMNSIEGWYRFECYAQLDQIDDGLAGGFWEVDVSPDSLGGAFPGTEGATWYRIWNATDYFNPLIRENFWIHANAQRGYFMQGRQNTGQDKGFGGWMLIHYLGSLGGSDTDNDWEFASP